ncbi:TetR/AcrR family transcriptional regulator [Geothrix alkalitolerans]|uniref:TetR/AcrR family transcriptional regulator n=1 Tax=Geothrix alkalitolerans TaxID=2922724 RepID=UPI001FB0394D|nr:TetR/AcrR family transcriptional regulator [Geothrix alkalitolerans]
MARPKAFDREQALQRALQTFWAKGSFESTSIQDLVTGMGINRQSLYDTFGPKEALYHAALERYRTQNRATLASFLEGPLPLRRALAAQFDLVVNHLLSPGGQPCLLAQAALGHAAGDPASAQCVQVAFGQNIKRLEARLRRAQADGELGSHHDPAALAHYFQNAMHGLQITARSGASRAELETIVRVNLSVLG